MWDWTFSVPLGATVIGTIGVSMPVSAKMLKVNLRNTDCLYSTRSYTEQTGIAGYLRKNIDRVSRDCYKETFLHSQGKHGSNLFCR